MTSGTPPKKKAEERDKCKGAGTYEKCWIDFTVPSQGKVRHHQMTMPIVMAALKALLDIRHSHPNTQQSSLSRRHSLSLEFVGEGSVDRLLNLPWSLGGEVRYWSPPPGSIAFWKTIFFLLPFLIFIAESLLAPKGGTHSKCSRSH